MDSPAPAGAEPGGGVPPGEVPPLPAAARATTAGDPGSVPGAAAQAKTALRGRFETARVASSRPAEGDRDDRLLALGAGCRTVACYASLPQEPATGGVIAEWHRRGVRVLVPLLRREPDWALHTGDYRPSWRGIPEPVGPRLGAAALVEARLIVVPGLAGTPDGRRLGTGGGWYDRALGHAAPGAVVVLLLGDDEVVADLPTEAWDRRVDLILTPTRTIRCQEAGRLAE
jgi:5-formyltetrahydrofolate cyclo-ligase